MSAPEAELAALLADLVRIDSVNPDLVPGGAGEAAAADFVADWGRAAGLEVHRVEPVAGRPSVVLVARGSGGGRSLMLNGHLDTVGVAGMAEPFAPRVEGGRLFGRGAFDMKGGVAACLWTAREAARLGWRGDVIVTLVADEEAASLGTRAVLDAGWTADACVVAEPTDLGVCVAHKGFVWLTAGTRGRAAHGSRPDLGEDAIVAMGGVLTGLGELADALRAGPAHPLLGAGSVHASLISGGQEMSSYPERCTLGVERRTLPGETPERAERELRRLLPPGAELRVDLAREPFEIDPDAPIVALLRAHAETVLGRAPRVYGETFWMDAALTSAAGIPTVVFGPGGAGAHATEEWADLGSLRLCADVLLATARAWCA